MSALPTLSQIRAWPTSHLELATDSWTATAGTWDDAFTAVYQQAPSPGGTPWDGQTADAAIQRVAADRLKVLGAVDNLRSAAAIACNGITDIQSARGLALQAVSQAQAAGFTVEEELSVTTTLSGPPAAQAARMAQARQLSAIIRSRAATLAAVDQQIATRITAATAGLRAIQFQDSPIQALGTRGDIPLGPVVWCMQPGTAGKWRCYIVYPNGGTDSYWSFEDESGGYG